MPHILHRFSQRNALYDALSDALAEALGRDHQAGLIVPGGKTPIPLFQRLASTPLAWSNIWLTLSDERWVSPDHGASNEGILRRTLLQNEAANAHFVPLYTGDATPEQAEATCHQHLTPFPWHNTICLLGMGNDGHIASLFPHNARLQTAIDGQQSSLCLAQTPAPLPPEAPYPRLTLTLAAILRVRQIYLLITGDEKLETLAQADEGDDVCAMPVRGLLQQADHTVSIYWAP